MPVSRGRSSRVRTLLSRPLAEFKDCLDLLAEAASGCRLVRGDGARVLDEVRPIKRVLFLSDRRPPATPARDALMISRIRVRREHDLDPLDIASAESRRWARDRSLGLAGDPASSVSSCPPWWTGMEWSAPGREARVTACRIHHVAYGGELESRAHIQLLDAADRPAIALLYKGPADPCLVWNNFLGSTATRRKVGRGVR